MTNLVLYCGTYKICQVFKGKLNTKISNPNLNLSGRNLKNLTDDKTIAAVSNYKRYKRSDNDNEIEIFFNYVLFSPYIGHTCAYNQIFTHKLPYLYNQKWGKVSNTRSSFLKAVLDFYLRPDFIIIITTLEYQTNVPPPLVNF